MIEELIGIGVVLGLSFGINALTFNDWETFLMLFAIFLSICVWVGLFPSWCVTFSVIIVAILIYQRWES